MHLLHPHTWEVSPSQAIEIQEKLRGELICQDDFTSLTTVAGLDVSFNRSHNLARAAIVLLRFPGMEVLECAVASQMVHFPYIPGLLSFREAPVLLAALSRLKRVPDLLFCDGHGFAHPRRFGLACHIGVLSGLPTIGVAKSCLVGAYHHPAEARGAYAYLVDNGEVIGAALRTRQGVKPIFVSIGHRISLSSAIELTLTCTWNYRLPEPIRQAHHLASCSRD